MPLTSVLQRLLHRCPPTYIFKGHSIHVSIGIIHYAILLLTAEQLEIVKCSAIVSSIINVITSVWWSRLRHSYEVWTEILPRFTVYPG